MAGILLDHETFYQQALFAAWIFLEDNFAMPFEGEQNLSQGFGPTEYSKFHNGVDWSGDFTVRAPASGTVTEVGPDGSAGLWRIREILRDESGTEIGLAQTTEEWSDFRTATHNLLHTDDTGEDSLLEPVRLLATGNWRDDAPNWSHTPGTVIRIDHGYIAESYGYKLETVYYHTNPSVTAGTTVNQGEALGETANIGWSTGTHLHYTVNFVYNGRRIPLNPLTPPAGIRHLLTP